MPISDIIASHVTGHEVNLLRYEAGMRRRARNILKELEIDLIRQINEIDPTSPIRMTVREQRLQKLLASTKETIRTSYARNRTVAKNALYDLAEIEVLAGNAAINTSLTVEVATATFSDATLRNLVDNVLVDGTPLQDWWSGQRIGTRRAFEREMRLGILQGEPLGTLRQRIRGTHTGKFETIVLKNGQKRRVGIFRGGIMETQTRHADTLIRTSTQAVANQVRDDTLSANNDLVKGRQALVTLDTRTSPICIARSGFAWDLEGSPIPGTPTNISFPGAPPWHPNCRTTLIPILRSFSELAGPNSKLSKTKLRKLDRAGTRTQSSMDGQVSSSLTYEQWLRRQSKARQIDVLGVKRRELWMQGKIKSLTQLVDQTGRSLTLKQLRARV